MYIICVLLDHHVLGMRPWGLEMLQQQSLQAGHVPEQLGQFADVGRMTQHHLELNKSRGKVVTSGRADQTIQRVELKRTEYNNNNNNIQSELGLEAN